MCSSDLFAAIEGGSEFWSHEIANNGALKVLAAIEGGFYPNNKPGIDSIKKRLKEKSSDELFEEIERSKSVFVFPNQQLWPAQLEDLKNPPIGLIMAGELDLIDQMFSAIAIVGTRNPTNYGVRVASDFAAGICDYGWSVISGGALGIDSAAHRGALAAEGLTIGILAGGINKPYPLANHGLFEEIREKGILISEFMPEVKPITHRFLIRNRLIAALSKGTLVVEAAFRSGSLRTARDASEIFRPVMAIPGPISVPTSEGCHRLISERCAELVSSVSEIMELVNPLT